MTSNGAELIRTLHDEHAAALWSFALRLTGGDRGRAEDIVQETLLRAWRNVDTLDDTNGSSRKWLFTVARRIAIDEWRSRQKRPEYITADLPEPGVDDGSDRVLQAWLVADALANVSEEHRQVVVSCYYKGHSVREAAAELDIPEGTVKSRLHYGLRALKLALDEMGVTG